MIKKKPSSSDIVMAFIMDEVDAGRAFPSAEMIREHMGWKNAVGAHDVLCRLAIIGLIRMTDRKPSGRGWKKTYQVVE